MSVLDQLRNDYGYFLKSVWPYLDKSGYAPLSDIEIDGFTWGAQDADVLGALYMWRSAGKSTGVTLPLPCWYWLRNADTKVKIVSKSKDQAMKFAKGVRGLLDEVPFLQHLRPPDSGWQADSATQLDVRGSVTRNVPSLQVIGGAGQKAGGRAHLIIADDLETTESVQTREARERLFEVYAELQRLLYSAVDSPIPSKMLVIGTYHSDQSVLLRLAEIGYSLRAYPLLYPDDYERPLIRGLAPIIGKRLDAGTHKPGQIVCPLRYTPDYVAREKATGRTGFWQQYMGIARGSESDSYPLQLRYFMVHPCQGTHGPLYLDWGQSTGGRSTYLDSIEVDALAEGDGFHGPASTSIDRAPWSRTHMRVDPAFSGKDKNVHGIGSTLGGNYFIRRLTGHLIGSGKDRISLDECARRQAADAKTFGARTCTVEANGGGEAFAVILQNAMNALKDETWACAVTAVPSKGQKEVRMLDAAEGPVQLKRVVLDESVARNPSLQHQLTRLTRVRGCLDHEDEAEVLCALIGDLKDNLRVDPERQRTKARERNRENPDEKKPRWGDRYRQTA